MNETKIRKEQNIINTNSKFENNNVLSHKNNGNKGNKNPVQYILIRANSKDKILQTITVLKTKYNLKLLDRPRSILPIMADSLTEEIMNSSIKNRSKYAAILQVEIADIKSFLKNLKEAKVPSHIVVITNKYKKVYRKISAVYKELDEL